MGVVKKAALGANPTLRTSGTQTLLRGLLLLEKVGEGVRDLPTLASSLGLSRSTTYRILSALVRAGYLVHEPKIGYRLGPQLIRLGFKAYGQLQLPILARPHLERLRDATNETVHLAIREGAEVIYIDKVPGRRELQLASQIGSRFPAQSTALGKAILAWLPEEEARRAFVPGLKRTERTIAEWELFLDELKRTRQRGYALDMEENETGVRCVAAPIFNGRGEPVAAVSVSTASIYLDDTRVPEVAHMVQQVAQAISRELGS
ncbi:helix-turn-helix domain-containing protein [Thermus antranikianii]|uniref:Helix-turn-helix domain-containing protein n=1 Tax=Thermus antranikianii TaxID=88190 RepID=A0ABY7RVK6_9DEIN|nr:helix-turn-helix domain-containing protein [Thermus antranikianii]